MDSITEHRAIVDTHRHPIGPKLAAKMAEAGLYDPKQAFPQANAKDLICYREFFDLDYAMPKQREGGVTLSLASNGGEVDWFSQDLLKVSTGDALKFLNDEYLEIRDRYPGEFALMANAHALDEDCRPIVEEMITQGGAKAIAVASSYGDGADRVFLDSPKAEWLWEFAEAHDIVVHIHPPMLTVGHEVLMQYRLNEAVGRPFDSTVNGARMIASGVFDRHPKLQVLIVHMGGELASVLGRLEFNWRLNYNGIANPPAGKPYTNKRPPSEYFKTNILVDCMGFNAIGVRAAVEMCGVDRVVFGSDYGPIPYGIEEHVKIVEDVLPNPAERQKVFSKTSNRVFRLGLVDTDLIAPLSSNLDGSPVAGLPTDLGKPLQRQAPHSERSPLNRRPILVLALTILLAPTLATPAAATAPQSQAANSQPKPNDAFVELHDFVFGDGESLASLKLHYLTLGAPLRDASGAITNGVLLLHGTAGSAADLIQPDFFDSLYGAGGPLDLSRYFLVIPDAIGAGESSKPSDGLHAHFPHFGYKDQVQADHRLLERIGVKHLRVVLGTSMGGMQTWLWGEMFPNGMDCLVALASTPAAISGRNMIWREMVSQAIRDDPAWNNGDYPRDSPPKNWINAVVPLSAIMTGSAEQLQKQGPTRKAAVALVKNLEASGASYDANDMLYSFESSADYDPAANLHLITKPMLTINFADDLTNPPQFLNLPTASNYTAVMIPGGPDSYGHMTIAQPAVWAPALQSFFQRLPEAY